MPSRKIKHRTNGPDLLLAALREAAQAPREGCPHPTACRRLLADQPRPEDRLAARWALNRTIVLTGRRPETITRLWREAATFARERWGFDLSPRTLMRELRAAAAAALEAEAASRAATPRELVLPQDARLAAMRIGGTWRGIVTVLPPAEVIERALGGSIAIHHDTASGTTYRIGDRLFRVTGGGLVTTHDDLVSPADVAELLGCGLRTVGAAIKAGKLPATQVGRGWVIAAADLGRWAPAAGPG